MQSNPLNSARETLARDHARVRRRLTVICLIILGLMVLGFGIGWFITRNVDYIYSIFFYGAFPIIWIVYFRYFMLPPHIDPVATEEYLKKTAAKQKKSARFVGVSNGVLLMITSPLLGVLFSASGLQEYGVVGFFLGAGVGLAGFCLGYAMFRWGRRKPE